MGKVRIRKDCPLTKNVKYIILVNLVRVVRRSYVWWAQLCYKWHLIKHFISTMITYNDRFTRSEVANKLIKQSHKLISVQRTRPSGESSNFMTLCKGVTQYWKKPRTGVLMLTSPTSLSEEVRHTLVVWGAAVVQTDDRVLTEAMTTWEVLLVSTHWLRLNSAHWSAFITTLTDSVSKTNHIALAVHDNGRVGCANCHLYFCIRLAKYSNRNTAWLGRQSNPSKIVNDYLLSSRLI